MDEYLAARHRAYCEGDEAFEASVEEDLTDARVGPALAQFRDLLATSRYVDFKGAARGSRLAGFEPDDWERFTAGVVVTTDDALHVSEALLETVLDLVDEACPVERKLRYVPRYIRIAEEGASATMGRP